MSSLLPTLGRVILKKCTEHVSEGGLYLPEEDYKENNLIRAEIMKVGPGRVSSDGSFLPMSVEVGDIVLVHRHGSIQFEEEGETFSVMPEIDIIAVLG